MRTEPIRHSSLCASVLPRPVPLSFEMLRIAFARVLSFLQSRLHYVKLNHQIIVDMKQGSAAAAEEQPDFRMADNHGYILDRGHLATARLNLQYFLWQRILKFTIHSYVKLPPGPKIADVATGTALWALDVAAEHPTAQLHGYDVDTTQAPAPEWLPANLRISMWDLFQDPPLEALGTYDLVHVRLLVLLLSGLDPIPVIRRLASLLKPGGWLQWEDIDCTRMQVKRVSPGMQAPSLDAIIDMSRAGGRHDWVVRLPEMLAAEGLVDAALDKHGDPDELGRALNDHLMMVEEFASGLTKVGKVERLGINILI